MEKRIGETVKFNKDLHVKYNPELIDFLRVYNFSERKFTKCDHWGWDGEGENEYDFGMIADFHFDISKTETRLYYGETPRYGFMENIQQKLIILPVACNHKPGFIPLGSFDLDEKFPAPKTMWDLGMHIDSFLSKRLLKFLEIKLEYARQMALERKLNTIEWDSDLPF
jgi:hypothetical protein